LQFIFITKMLLFNNMEKQRISQESSEWSPVVAEHYIIEQGSKERWAVDSVDLRTRTARLYSPNSPDRRFVSFDELYRLNISRETSAGNIAPERSPIFETGGQYSVFRTDGTKEPWTLSLIEPGNIAIMTEPDGSRIKRVHLVALSFWNTPPGKLDQATGLTSGEFYRIAGDNRVWRLGSIDHNKNEAVVMYCDILDGTFDDRSVPISDIQKR